MPKENDDDDLCKLLSDEIIELGENKRKDNTFTSTEIIKREKR